ncbi:MAG TPA: glycosyltransferase [Anaeromyxobacteraceae bacterium]|nr:glycosyltransferase [Anaeromyxobacteraceae bacterium]
MPEHGSDPDALLAGADALVHARPDLPDNVNVQSKLGLYLASGRPIAATDVGDYRALLGAAPGCVLAPPEPEALAAAIARAASDERVARAAREGNGALARQHFEASRNAERLLALYAALARPGAASRDVVPSSEVTR